MGMFDDSDFGDDLDLMELLTMEAGENDMMQQFEYVKEAKNQPVAATGKVLKVNDTGSSINTMIYLILDLEVTDNSGKVFTYNMKALVERIEIPRIGDTVSLITHPSEDGEYCYAGLKL